MRSRLLGLLRSPQCPTVGGRPRHLAAYVESMMQRARWVAAAAMILLIINAPLMLHLRHLFVWGFPGLVVLAHVVGVVSLAVLLFFTRGRLTVRRARAMNFVGGAGVLLWAAMLVGLSHSSAELVLILTLSLLVVLVVSSLRLYQLILLFALSLFGTVAFTLGGGQEVAAPFRWRGLLILFNPSCAAALAIVLNAWQYQSFRRRWKAEAIAGRRRRDLARQKSQIERLLVRSLPEPVAKELQRSGTFEPVVEEVCVIACDIVGFSKSCEAMPAKLIVEELQRFFHAFDECCTPHGLEPLRSQGDGVIALAGLWAISEGRPRRPAIDAVLAMSAFRERLAPANSLDPSGDRGTDLLWSARIGIHTGPVMMGVMDGLRLTFDVWGETVNVAARLEQGAGTNQILVSERSLWATRGLFEHGPIREVRVKDTTIAGAAEVVGIRPEFRDEGGRPNEAFWAVYRQDDYPIVAPHRTGSLQAERDA